MRPNKNISDKSIVLGRIDYGEKDRIITVLTPTHGKLKALAKSVRSGKSKLAGGIELFAENDIVLLKGRGDLYTLTSSRMESFFSHITNDINRTAYAYESLKNINKLTPDEAGGEYYPYLLNLLDSLNKNDLSLYQIKIWFGLRLLKLTGVSPDFMNLSSGQPIPPGKKYNFDLEHQCFVVYNAGKYNEQHIKILRYFDQKKKFISLNNCPNILVTDAAFLTEQLLKTYLH